MIYTTHKTGQGYFLFLLTLAIFSFLFTGCQDSKSEFIDEEILVQVPESQLYLRVRGNPDNPLIVNLHGGPGGYSGIDIKLMGPYLEDQYLIAYLDQRGCGKSLECTDDSLLNVDQYVKDLDIVIDKLLSRYNKQKTSLIGTSWGGMYGFLYLLKHQEKIESYACVDGKVNSDYQNHSLITYELKKATDLLKTDISEERKNQLNHIISELQRIRESNFEHFHTDVNWMKHKVPPMLGFNAYFADTSKIISLKDVLNDSSLLRLMKYTPEEYLRVGEKAEFVNEAFRNNPDYNNLNIEKDLARIKVPTMVIQGEMDFVVGRKQAKLIFDALEGVPPNMKELHILPKTGHCPAIESTEKLGNILSDFFGRVISE